MHKASITSLPYKFTPNSSGVIQCYFKVSISFQMQELKFASEMELNMFEVHLSHLEHVTRVGQEHITTFSIFGHILILAFFEGGTG